MHTYYHRYTVYGSRMPYIILSFLNYVKLLFDPENSEWLHVTNSPRGECRIGMSTFQDTFQFLRFSYQFKMAACDIL